MRMIKVKHIMCIGWEGSCKEATKNKLHMALHMGNQNFKEQSYQLHKL